MGNYFQREQRMFVYRRVLSSDKWAPEPVQTWEVATMERALSLFKHETYAFVLGKYPEYENTKAIYLYHGNVRVAKAYLDPETGQVEVWSTHVREWLASPEKLAKLRYPLQNNPFFSRYIKRHAWVNPQTITFIKRES